MPITEAMYKLQKVGSKYFKIQKGQFILETLKGILYNVKKKKLSKENIKTNLTRTRLDSPK